jgi:heptosyltransferase II
MNLLIEIPSWLGDAVMTTPAVENIINNFNDPKVTLVGSKTSIEVFKYHPKVVKLYVLDKAYISLIKTAIGLGSFDCYFSFRNTLRSRVFRFFLTSKKKYFYNSNHVSKVHQVEKYNEFINKSILSDFLPGNLIIYKNTDTKKKYFKFSNDRPILGINPGVSYGSAKRWGLKKFAEVAIELSGKYNILIFGGPDDNIGSKDIEKQLLNMDIKNFRNLSGKTSVSELINLISSLDLFITSDSGPMHVAACFQIKTISIFGPTKELETSQWLNKDSIIIKKNLDCQPCMKRHCPLKHNNCMKLISSEEIISKINL